MKSEERHRLQETELEKWGRHARSFWESFGKGYGKSILIGIGVASLLAVIAAWLLMSSAAAEAERWKAVILATVDPSPSQQLIQLGDAADRYGDTPAGQWATLMEAERALNEGVRAARIDRKASVDELTRARDAFLRLEKSDSEMIQERRAFGMANCLEALAGVDLAVDEKGEPTDAKGKNVSTKDALDAYKKFVENYGPKEGEEGGGSIFLAFAENRIKALSTERAETFYALYRREDPKPSDRQLPDLPPGHPEIPSFPPREQTGPTVPNAGKTENILDVPPARAEKPKSKTEEQPGEDAPKGPALIPPKNENETPAKPAPDKAEDNSDNKVEKPAPAEDKAAKPE